MGEIADQDYDNMLLVELDELFVDRSDANDIDPNYEQAVADKCIEFHDK